MDENVMQVIVLKQKQGNTQPVRVRSECVKILLIDININIWVPYMSENCSPLF
jgi:hypothetical protein